MYLRNCDSSQNHSKKGYLLYNHIKTVASQCYSMAYRRCRAKLNNPIFVFVQQQ